MDAQVISVAAGVVSVAIAALGLLLTWYRREGQKASATENRRREQIFRGAGVGIIACTLAAVTLTFIVGEEPHSSQTTETTISTESPKSSDGSMALSKAQYTARIGQACSDALEKGQRLARLRARETVLGAAVKVEEEELDEIRDLQPPEELQALHRDMVSIWQRRLSLLESVYQRQPGGKGDESELVLQLMTADQLADELAEFFKTLNLPECIL
jgi:hypothetical protein